MTKYYVSNIGSDTNDGLTPSTAWQTTNKVNSSSSLFRGGDFIYFRKGDTFYGQINLPTNITGGVITVSSYGIGKKPRICGYKVANSSSSWILHATNVWKIDLTNNTKFTGNVYSVDTNTGFIKVNGVIKGNKCWNLVDIATQWDFYNDSQYLYVYSTSNPTTLASDINIAVNVRMIPVINNSHITGLEIVGTGANAISGSVVNMKIINNEIHEIGGSELVSLPGVRYGNGIEIWSSSKDVLVENNKIYNCYDVALTMQGNLNSLTVGTKGWENVTFRNNTDWNCTQSFEVWSDYAGNPSIPDTGFYNCLYELNTSLNTGYSWGYDVRPFKASSTPLLVAQMLATNIDITVRNNSFYNPRLGLLYVNGVGDLPSGYKSTNNYVFLTEGQLINAKKTHTVEQFQNYQVTTGQEKGSNFFALPSSTSSLPAKLSFLVSQNGINNSRLKTAQEVLDNLNGKIEEMKNNLDTIQVNSKGTEIKHITDFIKPAGGYVTNQTSTVDNTYAPILRVNLKEQFAKMDIVLHYMLCADGTMNRNSIGVVNLQIVPNSTMTTGTQVDLDVFEIQEFNTGLSAQDFVLIVEKEDGTEVQATLYFNIGKDNFARLSYQPINMYTSAVKPGTYTFFDKATLITTLPTGTQYRPSKDNPYIKRPTTGTVAPASTPSYIGQEYIDTTNKKVYKAVGTTSSADWALMN